MSEPIQTIRQVQPLMAFSQAGHLRFTLIGREQGKQLIFEVNTQPGKSPVAVGFDGGQTQLQITGNSILSHAHQQPNADI